MSVPWDAAYDPSGGVCELAVYPRQRRRSADGSRRPPIALIEDVVPSGSIKQTSIRLRLRSNATWNI